MSTIAENNLILSMTDHDALFSKLDQLNDKLLQIEKTLVTMAVQEEKILSIRAQVSELKIQIQGLWTKYDNAFSPDGTISKLQACAASCPKDTFKNAIGIQWGAIASIIALMAALKIWD